MKIYLATSWKNEELALDFLTYLSWAGHEVDCFCFKTSNRYVFDYRDLKNYQKLNSIEFLKTEQANKAFLEDKKWIDWCDVLVMLLPCGNSSHLEAGYASGKGKKVYILGKFPVGEFDVMYGFAHKLIPYKNRNLLLKELDELKFEED